MNSDSVQRRIISYLQSCVEQKEYLTYGILGGDMAIVYYLFLFEKLAIGQYDPYKYLRKLINTLHSTLPVFSYCNGIAGLGYALHKLQEEGYVSNVDNSLTSFDNEIFKWYEYSLRKSDIDPLHGALGGLYYYTIRYKYNPEICKQALSLWCRYLRNNLEKAGNYHTIGFRSFENTQPYNLSLSHGLSGLIVISVEAFRNIPIENDLEIKKILRLLGDYLVHNVSLTSMSISCTPNFGESSQDPNISRLGWCYGDLGVALALYKLGDFLECPEFTDVAKSIVTHASKRRIPQNTLIMDRCICHGSSGVYTMFKYFNKYLLKGCLNEAVRYWFDYTYKDSIESPDLGLTKFAYYNNQDHTYELRTNLLDGIAGIGLGLSQKTSIIENMIFLT